MATWIGTNGMDQPIAGALRSSVLTSYWFGSVGATFAEVAPSSSACAWASSFLRVASSAAA
jgi:hypothetical protein